MSQEKNFSELISQLSSMKVIELHSLVKKLEEEWGVSAAAPVQMAAGAAAVVEEEKTEFDVTLKDGGAKKLEVIKEVRVITGLGLKEAKDLVEAGGQLKTGIAKAEAEEIKKKLEAAGATVVVS